MREIVFRGKRIDNGKWVYGGYAVTENQVYLIYNQAHSIDLQGFTVDENTIGQYTGLTDKNGKKIFEGDIVKVSSPTGSSYYAKIEYDCGCYWISNLDIQIPDTINNFKMKFVEVIGNIHDNSELL